MKTRNNFNSLLAVPALGLILLAGCDTNNDASETGPIAARITSTITGATAGTTDTRASETAWTNGDFIGVSTTSTQGTTAYTNIKYTANGTGGNFSVVNAAGEDNDIYFQDKKPVDFTAYYPYEGANGTKPGTDGIISRTLSVADQASDQLPKIDYLWSSTTGITSAQPTVSFVFRHCMSRLKLNFVEGSGMTFPAVGSLSYTLDGLCLAGTFNTLNGTAAADASAAKLEDIPVSLAAQNTLSTLILWPQTAATASLKVTVEGAVYSATLNLPDLPDTTPPATGKGLATGYSYSYNVKVHKTGIEISEAKITGWTTGAGGDVDANEEI